MALGDGGKGPYPPHHDRGTAASYDLFFEIQFHPSPAHRDGAGSAASLCFHFCGLSGGAPMGGHPSYITEAPGRLYLHLLHCQRHFHRPSCERGPFRGKERALRHALLHRQHRHVLGPWGLPYCEGRRKRKEIHISGNVEEAPYPAANGLPGRRGAGASGHSPFPPLP